MTTIAELGFAVHSESAVEATENLDGMVEAGARAEQAINKVAETSEQAKSRLLALGKAAMESSSYQEALNRAYEATAGASAAAAREQLNQSAALRQSAKAASESSVAQEKVAASEKKATAAIAEQRTQLEKLLGQIDPTTAAFARLGDQQRQLEKFKAAGILDPGTFNDYKAKIEQAESGLVSFDKTVARTGVSAKQSAAALRMLPAQFSDIFVSLQGGQAPLTVFLQQGSQIKDSFGGIGAAAKAMSGYIVGLVNPFTLAAAAAVGLGVAYYKGSEESTRFKTALILTGSAAGASADSLASMASKVGETVGTTGKAADALNQLASGGKIAGESFEAVAIAALSMEKATGRAVADTVAEFVKIGKDPVAAAKELNDQYGFLTASVYSQIVSLKEQGREQEAVKLLTDTYADTVQSRSKQVIENLSLWERAWNGVAGAAAQALDGLKNVGRESSYEDQIKALRAKLTGSEAFDVGGVRMNPGAVSKKDRDDIQAQINFIELQRDADRARAQYLADQSRFQKDAISGIDLINREAGAASTNVEKLNDRLAELGKARTKNLENNSWSTEEQAKYEKAAAALRKQIADAQKKATKVESSPVDLTSFNDADNKLKALTASYQNSLRILDASQKAGLISSQQYAEQKSALISKEKTEVEAAYNGQITALESVRDKSTTTGAQRIQIDQKIADARSKMVDALKKLDADQEVLSIELRGRLEKDEAAVKAFAQATQDSLNLDQRGLDSQLAGFGLSDRQRQRLQEDLKIQQDYQDKLEKLSRDRSRNQISESVYQQETQILNDALETRLQKQEDFYRKEDALRGDWSNGVSRAWRNYVEEAGDAAGMTESAFSDAFTGIEDVFVDFITTGKASFKDFANSVIADLARIVVKQQVIAPLLNAVFGGGGGGNGATSFGSAVGSLIGGGNASDSNGWGGMVSLGKNLYSAWSNLTGVGSSIASGYASGGVGGAISGGVGYYGNLLSSLGTTLSGGFSSIVGAITGSAATQVAANAATSAALQGAVAQGAAQVGTSIGIGGAAQLGAGAAAGAGTAAAAGAGAGFYASLAAMASNPVGWVIAAVTSAYQSGKLYDQGVRWDTKDVMNTDLVKYSGGIGQSMLAPLALTNNVLEKIVGGKMAAIFSGSTFASAIITKVSEKIFGGSWTTKDGGLSLGIEGGDFLGQQYIDQKKKGGLFGKDKKRTRYSALDPQMQEALQANYYDTQYSVLDLFTRLNVSLNDGVMDGLNVAATKISTKGKTGDEIQEAITKWFGGVADSMVSAVDAATNSGLQDYNFEALTTFVNNLYSVNDSFEMLGLKLYDVSVSTGFMAEQLVAMAGGAEAFNAANSTFFDSFYTDVEKTNYTLATVTKQFKAMDVALPGSRAAFRSVVDALDRTTESGRKMYVTLTGLAESASQAYTILEQQLTNAVTNAQSAVQRAISAQQKKATEAYNATNTSLNDMVSTVTENVNGLNSVSSSLSTALKALRGDSDDAVKMLRAQAQATLQSALATARSGKSLSGFTGLEDALDTVSNNNTDLYGSMEDFARDQGRTANVVAELNAINGRQLTSAEASLAGLKTQIDLAKAAYDAQMAQYDQALEFAQAQMDALNGVDTSIMGVTAAINAMNAAVVAALQGQATGAGKANTSGNNATLVETLYQSVLGRGSEAAGASYWGAKLQSGEVTYEQAAATIAKEALALDASKYAGTVSQAQIAASKAAAQAYLDGHKTPAFAAGGFHDGGLRLVGENGPELEVTGPSRIFNANQTAAMLKGGSEEAATVTELRGLRREMQANFEYISKHIKATADHTDELANRGMQIVGTVDTRAVPA